VEEAQHGGFLSVNRSGIAQCGHLLGAEQCAAQALNPQTYLTDIWARVPVIKIAEINQLPGGMEASSVNAFEDKGGRRRRGVVPALELAGTSQHSTSCFNILVAVQVPNWSQSTFCTIFLGCKDELRQVF
jgi:hypothetical protein